jgi:endonuclease III
MTRKERFSIVLSYLEKTILNAETELIYDTPYQLLVAVVLSAQCTDKRVNIVTPPLFARFPEPIDLANATVEEIFHLIRSISYPNNKAKHLQGLGKLLVEKFNSRVPMTVDELILLPGVGRKTANVITSVIDKQPNMAVDTHVFRVSKRLGLILQKTTTPLSAEKQLIKEIPSAKVHEAHHWMILFGRYTCLARSPKCKECGLAEHCLWFKKTNK